MASEEIFPMLSDLCFKLKDYVKKSDNFLVKKLADFYVLIYIWSRYTRAFSSIPIFFLCRLLPLQNKIVATTFSGRKYGDNPQQIIEKVHKKNKNVKLIWLKDTEFSYETPNYVKEVPFRSYWRKAYEMATAKIWINSHRLEWHIIKRANQTFIETWHGGLGVKKIEMDNKSIPLTKITRLAMKKTNQYADVFISNSNHLNNIYRNAFDYKGPIWKIGYPKNDILFSKNKIQVSRSRVRKYFSLQSSDNILVYAPTFRDCCERNGLDPSIYSFDCSRLITSLEEKFFGKWVVLIRLHPVIANVAKYIIEKNENVVDATQYPDSQELILGANAFISDYSSMLFDAAMTNIPCFTYAKDYVEYKNSRGLYYNLEDLPFPLATNNEELMSNIMNFDCEDYHSKWASFKKQMGLIETDSSAEKIADLVNDVIKNGKKVLVNYNFKT